MAVNLSTIGMLDYYKLAAALFLSVMLFRQLKKGRDSNPNGLPLPPGPRGYPLIGNLFDMPVHKPWLIYDEWRRTYGKIFIINDLSPQITGGFRWYGIPQCPWPALCNFEFLGSHHRPAWERSSNYSDRKHLTMSHELYVSHLFTSKNLLKMPIDAEWIGS